MSFFFWLQKTIILFELFWCVWNNFFIVYTFLFANNTLAGTKSNINVKKLEGYKVNSILRVTQILKIFNSSIEPFRSHCKCWKCLTLVKKKVFISFVSMDTSANRNTEISTHLIMKKALRLNKKKENIRLWIQMMSFIKYEISKYVS